MHARSIIIVVLLFASAISMTLLALYGRRRTLTGPAAAPAAAPPKIVYRDTPTVRLVAAPRVDRLRKVLQLRPGEHADVLEGVASLPARFRITLKRIVAQGEHGPAAHISVDFGGAVLSGGAAVQEFAVNEFVVPRAQRDESRSCVFYIHERGDSMEFTRIKLRNIDAAAGCAELDVLQVSGRWPS